MKPRHAAALALVGWYLIVAPGTGVFYADGAVRDTSAPLEEWEDRGNYDSFDDCREEAIKLFPAPTVLDRGHVQTLKNRYLYRYGSGLGYVCVSSADPGLKRK